MRVDQLLAGFADGDAISHEALLLQAACRGRGLTSEIFAEAAHVSPSLRPRCRPLEECPAGPADLVIHHYSIDSDALRRFAASPARKILRYHNVTPDGYFRGFDDGVAARLRAARDALGEIAARADAVWAVSEFNAREVRALGVDRVRVLPLLFSSEPLDAPDLGPVLDRFEPRLTTWLFVGRIAPNKRVEDIVEAFFWYRLACNPYSRLMVVGSEWSCPRYFAMLRMLVGDLDVPNVCFEGFAAPEGLPTYYRNADLFITASEHEGYCLPLVEAMHAGLPVLARDQGGMPEALGGAGVRFEGLRPPELACLADRILRDRELRERVLASQRRRLDEIRGRDAAAEIAALLAEIPARA